MTLLHAVLGVLDTFEQVPGVLNHREVHFHLNLDRPTVNIVRIGASVCGCLREFALFSLTFVVTNDRLKPSTLIGESTAEPLEC